MLLDEHLELGETHNLFEHDFILDNLWQVADDDVAFVFVVGRRFPGLHEVLDRALLGTSTRAVACALTNICFTS